MSARAQVTMLIMLLVTLNFMLTTLIMLLVTLNFIVTMLIMLLVTVPSQHVRSESIQITKLVTMLSQHVRSVHHDVEVTMLAVCRLRAEE
jgi:hypothetical protein